VGGLTFPVMFPLSFGGGTSIRVSGGGNTTVVGHAAIEPTRERLRRQRNELYGALGSASVVAMLGTTLTGSEADGLLWAVVWLLCCAQAAAGDDC
jgi:hypothetical protein